MPETQNITFTHKEIVEALLKDQGITEGLWGIYIEFGIAAGNVGSDKDNILPVAVVPVKKIGIQRFPEENNLTVDASTLNPKK